MNRLKFIVTFGLTITLLVLGNSRLGMVPPLGKFFDPFHGLWRNATIAHMESGDLALTGLTGTVQLVWDDRGVAHIFAQNDEDLYFAQGYMTAHDRLWQMEFQTYVAAGRLCEIFGERPEALRLDRMNREMGVMSSAETSMHELSSEPETQKILQAYSRGVNAYIDSLATQDYPLEYKIFDYAPERWEPLKCILLLKYMSVSLARGNTDREMSLLAARFGEAAVAEIFPHAKGIQHPVIPEQTAWDFAAVAVLQQDKKFKPTIPQSWFNEPPEPEKGSNNWAVAGSKTQSGFPLLASDPHMELTLPSLWYEIQLVSPSVNVYGVSLPGAPCVIIGFNQNVAWGLTNSGVDVADWYEIKFKDKTCREYWHDNQWKAVRAVRQEKIVVRGGRPVTMEVVYTHHGPVPVEKGEPYLAFRWAAHDISNELKTFYLLNRASTYDEYVNAIRNYTCPAQNFAFANHTGDIALWHNGRFPLRWEGQGVFISDGTDPAYDWPFTPASEKRIPHAHNPHVKNPTRGFVSSANQYPVAENYPYFLHGAFEYYRNVRINERLEEMQKITMQDCLDLQNDNKNLHAREILPALLKMVAVERLNDNEQQAFTELVKWDFFNDAAKAAPSIFDLWWRTLYKKIWNDEFGNRERYKSPGWHATTQLILKKPDARWFDNIDTPETETMLELVRQSFSETCATLLKKYGTIQVALWGKYQGANVQHLARIPGLGRLGLFVGGGRHVVNAVSGNNGPSWKMVVSLSKRVKAWGAYPGGQSGNPASPYYDNFVDTWAAGKLNELLYLEAATQENTHIVRRINMGGK